MPEVPWDEVVQALRLVVAPTLITSLVLMLVLALVLRLLGAVRLTPVAAAVAVAAGVFVGNEYRNGELLPWQIDNERPLSVQDLSTVLAWSVESKPASNSEGLETAEELAPVPAHYWLPWLGGLALLVELLARLPRLSPGFGWVARTLVALLAGRLLTSAMPTAPLEMLRPATPWMSWGVGLTIVLEWAVLIALARRWKDGTTAATLSLCFGAASVLLLYAQYPRIPEMALLLAAALVGPAVVAWIWPGDTGGALGIAAVLLPGLLLVSYRGASTEVPRESYLLLGLAPLALAPMLLPRLARLEGWKRWLPVLILPLIPAIVALVLAAQAAKLAEEETVWPRPEPFWITSATRR